MLLVEIPTDDAPVRLIERSAILTLSLVIKNAVTEEVEDVIRVPWLGVTGEVTNPDDPCPRMFNCLLTVIEDVMVYTPEAKTSVSPAEAAVTYAWISPVSGT